MNQADKDIIVTRYRRRFNQHGHSVKAVATGPKESCQIRFGVLQDVGDLQNCRILDIGCGLADFYAFLKNQQVNVDYVGVDIVPEFIQESKKLYPEQTFYCVDITEEGCLDDQRFDYAVCSQVFNNKLQYEDNLDTVACVMKKLYELVEKGFAFDFISSYVDFEEPRHYYYSPEKVFSLAKKLTKRVTLRHDYPLYEFCLYVYKDFKAWGKAPT